MTTFLEKCEEYFGSKDFYKILDVKKTSSDKQVKKAYHKLSLLVHPDRVAEDQKEEATEKFKVLGRIHSILQDSEKRNIYDETGSFDEEDNDAQFNWMQYWRAMFKPVTTQDIDKYKESYIGSDKELCDIKKAYEGSKGDMDHIFEMVAFTGPEDEPRIIEIVRKMVDDGEVEEYDCFFNEPKKKKDKRKREFEREAEEASSLNIDDSELAQQIQKRHEQRGKEFANLLNSIEEKYAKKNKKRKLEGGASKNKRRITRSTKSQEN